MACFGAVVDDNVLNGMPRYHGQTITQQDRAREAMHVKDERYDAARQYVDRIKDTYGFGISTRCLVYNGTGETLEFVADHNYSGHLVAASSPYPAHIGNGQWASFLHGKTTATATGSVAAVVYKGKQRDGLNRQFKLSWCTPWSDFSTNKAYCAMSGDGSNINWDDIKNRTNDSGRNFSVHVEDMNMSVSIETGSSPIYEGVLNIPYGP